MLAQYFMRGTLLEQISQDFSYIGEQLQNTSEAHQRKKADLVDMKEEVKQIGHKLKDFQQLDQLQERMTEVKAMMAWAQVKEQRDRLNHVANDKKKAKSKVTQIEEKVENLRVFFFFHEFPFEVNFTPQTSGQKMKKGERRKEKHSKIIKGRRGPSQ